MLTIMVNTNNFKNRNELRNFEKLLYKNYKVLSKSQVYVRTYRGKRIKVSPYNRHNKSSRNKSSTTSTQYNSQNLYQSISNRMSNSIQNATYQQQQSNLARQSSITQGVNLIYTVIPR